MPKQNIYQSQSGPASLRVQPAPRVLSRPDATSSADMLLDAAVKAGMAVVGAFERGREIEERRLIDEALLEHGREFGLWRGDYESSRQGKDALSAQHDFLARSEELAAAKMEELGERLSPEGRNMLSREFAKRGLYAIEDGGRYQARQTALWNESRLNGQLELFAADVAANPDNEDRIRQQMRDLEESWRVMNPGLDSRAFDLKIRNAAITSRLDGWLAAGEHDKVEAFLQRGEEGSDEAAALSGSDRLRYRHAVERGKERAKSARFSAMSASVWEETQGLPWEKRNEAAIERIAAITDDPKEQRALFAAFERDAAFQKIRENAATGKAARELAEDAFARDILPGEFLAELNRRDDITPEARTRAMELFRGEVKESPKNRAALRDLRADIDNGAARSSEDVEAFAFNHGLTPSQTKDALAYLEDNGKTGGLTQTRLDRLWKNAAGGRAPDDLFQWVRDQLPDGKKPTDKDLEDLMAKFAVKGTSPGKGRLFDGETLLEALRAHRGNEWLPDVSGAEFREISAVLRARGLPHTMEAARRYKKNVIMGIEDRRETESER